MEGSDDGGTVQGDLLSQKFPKCPEGRDKQFRQYSQPLI
jgi:hypothetical protein